MNAVPYDGGNGRLFDAHYANDGLGAGRFFFFKVGQRYIQIQIVYFIQNFIYPLGQV